MVAQIIINTNARSLNKIFDYSVPEEMYHCISIGSRVLVPFGRSKALQEGFVIGLKEESPFVLKAIAQIEDKTYLGEKEIELAKMMAQRYFCNLSDCIRLMLPPGTTTRNFSNRIQDKKERFVFLLKEEDEIESEIESQNIKSEKQIRALRFLAMNGEVGVSDLKQFADVSLAVLNTLAKHGYIEMIEKEVERNPFLHKKIEKTKNLKLTEEQEKAFQTIKTSIEKSKYQEFLLFGVTGSGKTEVYIQLIEQVLNKKKTSMILVPEISLTPQMVDRFIARFGEDKIAVLHSKLSLGERYDQWKKIERGEAKIVIGARSAIFAPLKNLGIIIMDEEHDESYKSETNPRYHTRDIANFLAKRENIPFVLGSATPDIKTFYQAKQQKMTLLELSHRANAASLPEVEIVDLRNELSKGNKSMLSEKLQEMIATNIEKKHQTILFLNRRGFSTFIMCRDCGYTAKCKNCNISMTYHIKDRALKCHYCGYEQQELHVCPECHSKNIRYFGTGTQKLEMEIKKRFPQASVIRMDIDTVTKKNSHEEILKQFKNERIDILIGTQMIVKGHDFPNVTLVGVIAADSSLNLDDYRASERTFQILTQVEGRSGRGKEKGSVIVQTYNPDNFSIECAKEQNYQKFYETEIELRKQLRYPPFCDIIQIGISGIKKEEVRKISLLLYQFLEKEKEQQKIEMNVFQPGPAPIDRIKNKIRWRMIIKCKLDVKIMKLLHQGWERINQITNKKNQQTKIVIDVNPNNML